MARDGLVLAGALAGVALGQAIGPSSAPGSSSCSGWPSTGGWTVFGLVTQDYRFTDETLAAVGWDLLDVQPLAVDPADVAPLAADPFDVEPLTIDGRPIEVVRRGLIAVRTVGYLTAT